MALFKRSESNLYRSMDYRSGGIGYYGGNKGTCRRGHCRIMCSGRGWRWDGHSYTNRKDIVRVGEKQRQGRSWHAI